MKKTIVIVIILIYIASIAVVNFFGLEVKVFDGITYVESIQCNSITVHNERQMFYFYGLNILFLKKHFNFSYSKLIILFKNYQDALLSLALIIFKFRFA